MVTRREPKEDMSFDWSVTSVVCAGESVNDDRADKALDSGFKRGGVEGAGLESVRKQKCESAGTRRCEVGIGLKWVACTKTDVWPETSVLCVALMTRRRSLL